VTEEPKRRVSFRAAVNRMCKACIYDPIGGSGTWREQVRDCTSPGCPLYEVRPMPAKVSRAAIKADFSANEARS